MFIYSHQEKNLYKYVKGFQGEFYKFIQRVWNRKATYSIISVHTTELLTVSTSVTLTANILKQGMFSVDGQVLLIMPSWWFGFATSHNCQHSDSFNRFVHPPPELLFFYYQSCNVFFCVYLLCPGSLLPNVNFVLLTSLPALESSVSATLSCPSSLHSWTFSCFPPA